MTHHRSTDMRRKRRKGLIHAAGWILRADRDAFDALVDKAEREFPEEAQDKGKESEA